MVTVLERVSGKVLKEIPVGVEPEGMAVRSTTSWSWRRRNRRAWRISSTPGRSRSCPTCLSIRARASPSSRETAECVGDAEIGGTVAVIDGVTRKLVKKIGFQIPGVKPELIQPMGVRFTKDGTLAFVALSHANRVAVIDTATYEVQSYILVGRRPWHMDLHPDGHLLYVANGLTNDMTIVDVASLKPLRSVPVGRLPWGVAVKP